MVFDPSVLTQTLRSGIIAFLMLVHIQFAALLIGLFGLGMGLEFIGMLSPRHPHFDRAARGIARTCILSYSTGAVLAIIFILWMNLLQPTFWAVILRINFWPMLLEDFTFVLTVLYLFPWYYTWDRLAGFKPVHLALAAALWFVAQLQQGMIDVMAGYMLTPSSPPGDVLRSFINPTVIPLDMHRIVGDISFAGFVVAGYAAIRTLRAKENDKRAYFDWLGSTALLVGLGFLILQPMIGIEYAMEIRVHAPHAFNTMFRGHISPVFLVLGVFYSLLFGLSAYYMFSQVRKSGRDVRRFRPVLLTILASALLLIQPSVIGWSQYNYSFNFFNPIGAMQPWKYIAFGGLTVASFIALIYYLTDLQRGLKWGKLSDGGRGALRLLITLAAIGSATMLMMGYVRENSRQPYLINFNFPINQLDQFPPLPSVTPTPGGTPTPTPLPSGDAPAGPSAEGGGGGR